MEETIVVDGYNIMHAWPELEQLAKESSLEHARIKLVDALNNFQGYKGCRVIVVFDAYYVKKSIEKMEKIGAIEAIYSGEGQTADMVIEKLVGKLSESQKVYVATSDYNEQRVIFGRGAYRISARELIRDIKLTLNKGEEFFEVRNQNRRNLLESRLKGSVKETLESWRRQK